MALYALDEARLVYAAEAKEKKIYRCAGCKSPVQVRKGPFRVPHYYHLGKSPTCRLYSKSEDHMLAQLFIQAMLPPGEAFIEYPFLEVNRVADVLWKPAKIIFEIQCSLMSPHEAQSRIHDYEKLGYKIVWILDDHLYNRKMLKPAEKLIRNSTCYYATLRKQEKPFFYDQFEMFYDTQRNFRGKRLPIALNSPQILTCIDWKPEHLPEQIVTKARIGMLYFHGDLIHRAKLTVQFSTYQLVMQNFRALELQFQATKAQKRGMIQEHVLKWILEPFGLFLFWLMEKAAEKR